MKNGSLLDPVWHLVTQPLWKSKVGFHPTRGITDEVSLASTFLDNAPYGVCFTIELRRARSTSTTVPSALRRAGWNAISERVAKPIRRLPDKNLWQRSISFASMFWIVRLTAFAFPSS